MASRSKQPGNERQGSVDPSLLRQVDEICDAFEREWNAGGQPQIEQYLADVADPLRKEV